MGLRERCQEIVRSAGKLPDAERLQRLFETVWDHEMEDSPELATFMGHPGQNDRWADLSRDAIDRRKREAGEPLDALATIDRHCLDETDRTSYDLFEYDIRRAVSSARFPSEYLALSQMDGPQQDLAMVLSAMPRDTIEHYDDMVARLRGVATVVEQTRALLEEGLRAGVTPPRITLRDVPSQFDAAAAPDPDANPLTAEFVSLPPSIPEREHERLRKEAADALSATIVPAFRQLGAWMSDTYLSNARETIACTDLPNGEAWYEHRVRYSTTTELKPAEIHDLGQSEVARIRALMDDVMGDAGHTGTFDEFTDFLRKDARFFYDSADDLLAGYRDICKRIDPELCKLFGTLPRLPYGVVPVPDHTAPSQTTAYYLPGSPEANRPGLFYANTYDLPSRPKWEMEALTLHEAVPGHHLQIAIAQELSGLPKFRRLWSGYTAYVEGWGLYAESLGSELGFYRDPYSHFGQLTYEMWRAIRLVVDTGMHALGWTRDRAIEFFIENAGKAEHDIVVEVDRYIVWPGQALAYKLGELKLKELRADATHSLGAKFDVRAFHDAVLGQGALPLDVLDTQMRAWVGQQAEQQTGSDR